MKIDTDINILVGKAGLITLNLNHVYILNLFISQMHLKTLFPYQNVLLCVCNYVFANLVFVFSVFLVIDYPPTA